MPLGTHKLCSLNVYQLHVLMEFQIHVFQILISQYNFLHWGTGIRGLMRGMATLLQGIQELLVVRDKVGRPPR